MTGEDNEFLTPELREALAENAVEAERRKKQEKKLFLTLRDAGELIDAARAKHPYKVPGDYDSYAEYNQGWQDALDHLEGLLPMKGQSRYEKGWISVKERMPPDNTAVLIYVHEPPRHTPGKDGKPDVEWPEQRFITRGYHSAERSDRKPDGMWYEYGEWGWGGNDVKFWRPMPEPPVESWDELMKVTQHFTLALNVDTYDCLMDALNSQIKWCRCEIAKGNDPCGDLQGEKEMAEEIKQQLKEEP